MHKRVFYKYASKLACYFPPACTDAREQSGLGFRALGFMKKDFKDTFKIISLKYYSDEHEVIVNSPGKPTFHFRENSITT